MEKEINDIIPKLKLEGKTPQQSIDYLIKNFDIIKPKAIHYIFSSDTWKHLMSERNPFTEEFINQIRKSTIE